MIEHILNTSQKLWGIVQDFYYIRRQKSTQDALKLVTNNIRNLVYNHITWVVLTRNTNDSIPSYQLKLPIIYQNANLENLALLEPIVLPTEFEYFRKRLLHGRICILALYQNQTIAYYWMTSEVKFLIDNLNMKLKDGDAYLDDLYVLPAYRGKDIGKAFNAHMINFARERGFNRVVGIVDINNIPSIKLCKSNGWQEIDHMTFHRFLFYRNYHYVNNSFG